MLCEGYTKTLDLTHGDLVKLDDARGTTLRVTRGTLWVTQEHDHRDVMLNAGDVWTVERDGLTLVEAQTRAGLCLIGPGAEPAHVRERSISGADRLRALFSRWVAV